jgi:myo-inositol-1(or 4)-monophosphatase
LSQSFERERAFAERVAREAGALLVRAYGRVAAREKGPSDLVTEADTASQRLIASRIAETFPDHTLHAEEDGVVPDPSRPWKWVVDPLDGTINFAHGFPFWSVSIALEFEGRLVVGVVHDPLAGVLFAATAGQGACREGEPIGVSRTEALRSSLISAGLPTRFDVDADRQLALFRAFSTGTHSVRRTGSTALNLAYLAAGGFDLYYTTSVHPWDVAAGVLLVEEAGGRVTALDGSPYRLDQPTLLASNRILHEEAMARVRNLIPGP